MKRIILSILILCSIAASSQTKDHYGKYRFDSLYSTLVQKGIDTTNFKIVVASQTDGKHFKMYWPVYGGITTIGTVDATADVKGATISGNTITMHHADINYAGLISASDQTLGGVKTFASGLTTNTFAKFLAGTAPGTPASGYGSVYEKSDKKLYFKDDAGVEYDLTSVGGGTTTNALTFNNSGSGDASGTTFNGATARTLSYNSIGAAHSVRVNSTTYTADATGLVDMGTLAAGGWNGGTSGTAYTATSATIDATALVWTFTGSSPATFTLPAYSTFGNRIVIVRNIGTADLTISRAGTDQIYTSSTVTSFTLPASKSITIAAAANGLTNTWETLFDPATAGGSGTVTQVTFPTTPSWLTPSVATNTTTPAISLTATSGQTANQFLATPDGSTGPVGLRAIVAADIPTLNQNTTGSAASLTTTRTIWGQNFNGTANVTGDLGTTGSRVTKVWATDGEFTNMPTINGTSLSSTASTLSNKGIDFASNTITATSAQLRTALSDENGTGAALFNGATTPDFTTGITVGGAAASGNILQGNGTNYVPTANNGGWTTVRVSGSDATTTGQSLVDITGLASGTLTNSTKYEIEARLDVSTSAVTTGTEYGIGAGGTGGAAVVSVMLTGTTTGTSASSEGLSTTAGTASTARLLTSGQSGTILLQGFVTTRGSGTATISIQHLKVTSGTSTVKVGSVFRYRLAQ